MGRVGWCGVGWIMVASLATRPGPLPRASGPNSALKPIRLTCLDPEATGYATFQSHNQKVVWTRRGIFAAYIRTRNAEFTAQTWRLVRSTDGGKTFSTVYEAVHATNPPVLEADRAGNLYLIRADFVDGNAYLYRFLAARKFAEPAVTKLEGGAAGKYAACLDEKRGTLYFFSHNGRFFRVPTDGGEPVRVELVREGRDAVLQYPSLCLDDRGRLHAAWTSQKKGVYLYWDIHHMLSEDGGQTWRNMTGERVPIPVAADQTGHALRISLDDEDEVHTWLSSFAVAQGKAHFVYLSQSQPPRQRYVRYDIATGRIEVDIRPEFRGETIRLLGLDSLLAVGRGKLYCVGNDGGRLACLVSSDNGRAWHDYARSQETLSLYAIGGARAVTPSGEIIGTFTDSVSETPSSTRKPRVFFFRIAP